MEKRPDHYAVLEVSPRARQAVIEAAYKRLVRDEHPDVNGGALVADKRTRAITQAYAVLSDPLARARYDRERPPRPPLSVRSPEIEDWEPDWLVITFCIAFGAAFLPGCFLLRIWWVPLGAVMISLACGYLAGAWHVGIVLTGRLLESYVPGSNIAGWILGERFPGRSAAERIRAASWRVRVLVAALRLVAGLLIGVVATPFALIATWSSTPPSRNSRGPVVYEAPRWTAPDVPVRDSGHPRLTGGGLEKR